MQGKRNDMERFVEQSLLYDFYGELLTERQQRIYEELVFDDYSVSEIARDEGISRQGVHDMRRRCEKTLLEYEARLHLVERFLRIRENVNLIQKLTEESSAGSWQERMRQIREISSKILEEL